MPRTFWISAKDKARCALEQCALEVFHHHVKDTPYDAATSGAEWWVQIRPSPPAGRYALLTEQDPPTTCRQKQNKDNNTSDGVDLEHSGICFHWDKDEDLRLLMGGNMYLHPHISTVTYLTNIGAPTMALNYRVDAMTGQYLDPADEKVESRETKGASDDGIGAGAGGGNPVQAYISWPKRGKHLSFDGRYLHAAPSNLMKEGVWKEQTKVMPASNTNQDERERKKFERQHRRVTFLVNIWLNYKPFNVNEFPECMLDKLSKVPKDPTPILFSPHDKEQAATCSCQEYSSVGGGGTGGVTEKGEKEVKFEWQMGACDSEEHIKMALPLDIIQGDMESGGNILVLWNERDKQTRGISLSQPSSCQQAAETVMTIETSEIDEGIDKAKRRKVSDQGES